MFSLNGKRFPSMVKLAQNDVKYEKCSAKTLLCGNFEMHYLMAQSQ